MRRPTVLAMPKLPEKAVELMHDEFVVHRLGPNLAVPPQLAAEIRAIASPGRDPGIEGRRLGAPMFDQLPGLEIISSFSSGLDGIDVQAALAKGIAVGHAPDVLAEPVADIALGLAIDIMRGMTAGDRHVKSGLWGLKGPTPLATSLAGKTAGIFGLGRIGKALARRLEACGMNVAYSGRRNQPGIDYRYVETLAELAGQSDILFLCAPATEATEGIVDASILTALGPSGFIVNVSRGSLIDEEALIEALRGRRIAGAGLDVVRNEPEADPRLFELPNLVILPHLGGSTEETRLGMFETMVENLRCHFAGRPIPFPFRVD